MRWCDAIGCQVGPMESIHQGCQMMIKHDDQAPFNSGPYTVCSPARLSTVSVMEGTKSR